MIVAINAGKSLKSAPSIRVFVAQAAAGGCRILM
jgi:hypothetical protein